MKHRFYSYQDQITCCSATSHRRRKIIVLTNFDVKRLMLLFASLWFFRVLLCNIIQNVNVWLTMKMGMSWYRTSGQYGYENNVPNKLRITKHCTWNLEL